MPNTTKRTDQVLASARKDLEAQLEVVRAEIARLEGDESALTQALSSLDGGKSRATATGNGTRSASTARGKRQGRVSQRQAGAARLARGGSNKSTADRVDELRQLLAEGPKSRNDLAAALAVSPARVQQLLTELGTSVSSKPDPSNGRGKLWSLERSKNGAGAGGRASRGGGRRKRGSAGARSRPRGAGT